MGGIRKRLGLAGENESPRAGAPPWWASLFALAWAGAAGFARHSPLGLLAARADGRASLESVVVVLAVPTPSPRSWRPRTRSRYLTVKAVAAEVPPGRALELWMLPDGSGPVSMGLVRRREWKA